MSAATRADVRARTRAILAAKTAFALGTDVTLGVPIAAFPAFEVTLASATRTLGQKQGHNDLTLNVHVFVYTVEVPNELVSDDAFIRSVLPAAEAQIDPVADWLAAHQLLRLPGAASNPNGLVSDMSAITDTGAGLLDYYRVVYAGFTLEFTITIRH